MSPPPHGRPPRRRGTARLAGLLALAALWLAAPSAGRAQTAAGSAAGAPGSGPGAGSGAAAEADAASAALALREADAALQKAAEAQAQIAHRRSDPDYAEPWQEEAADSVEAGAAKAIAACRARIGRARSVGPVAEVQDATRCVARARQDLEALAGRLDQRRNEQRHERDVNKAGEAKLAAREAAERQAREKAAQEKAAEDAIARQDATGREQELRQSARQEIDRLAVQARKVLDRSLAAQPRGTALDGHQTRLRDLLRTAAHPPETVDGAQLQQLLDDLAVATTDVEKGTANAPRQAGPPPELRAAARALFRADYAEVVRTLSGAVFADRRATVTAALLLSAARYSLFLQGGEKDPALEQQARDDARTCRRLQSDLAPDPKLFSPRFVDFFRAAR